METAVVKIKRYDVIDGLHAFSCLGIILMHIQANTVYENRNT